MSDPSPTPSQPTTPPAVPSSRGDTYAFGTAFNDAVLKVLGALSDDMAIIKVAVNKVSEFERRLIRMEERLASTRIIVGVLSALVIAVVIGLIALLVALMGGVYTSSAHNNIVIVSALKNAILMVVRHSVGGIGNG